MDIKADPTKKPASIFKSKIFLEFNEKSYEKTYSKRVLKSLESLNSVLTSLNLCISVVTLVIGFILLLSDLNFLRLEILERYFENSHLSSMKTRRLRISKLFVMISGVVFFIFVMLKRVKTKTCAISQLEFFFNIFLQGINFHIFSGIIRSYFYSNSDFLILIQGVSILYRKVVIIFNRGSWVSIVIVTSSLIFFQSFLMFVIHPTVPVSLKEYLLVDNVFLLFTLLLAFYIEVDHRIRFYNSYKSKLEKDHLFDVLNKLQQGFYVFNSEGNLTFSNTFGEDIIKKYNNKRKSSLFDVDNNGAFEGNRDYKVKYDYLKGNVLDFNMTDMIDTSTENLSSFVDYLDNESISSQKKNLNLSPKRIRKNYPEKARVLEAFEEAFRTLLSILIVNKYIPSRNLYNYFTELKKKESKQQSISLTEICSIILNDQTLFQKFTRIGTVKFNSSGTFSQTLNDLDFSEYEVSVRSCNVDGNSYIEFIFSDITQVILQERKSTINQCKSNYLAKIAHEVNNPLCSIIELSEEIVNFSQSVSNDTNQNNRNIHSFANYISNICNLMNYLTQDFFLTSTFDEFCIVCEESNLFCETCSKYSRCLSCNKCQTCYRAKNFTNFSYNEMISKCIKVFQTKSEIDRNQMTLKLETMNQPDIHDCKIHNNADYFNSIIFNLIYHIYNKNHKTKEVVVNSKFINPTSNSKGRYLFEVIEYVNSPLFKYSVNTKSYSFKEYVSAKKMKNSYDVIVHLHNAYILARKLGSEDLFIEENEGGIKYYFFVENFNSIPILYNNLTGTNDKNVTSKFDLSAKQRTKTQKENKSSITNSIARIAECSIIEKDFTLSAKNEFLKSQINKNSSIQFPLRNNLAQLSFKLNEELSLEAARSEVVHPSLKEKIVIFEEQEQLEQKKTTRNKILEHIKPERNLINNLYDVDFENYNNKNDILKLDYEEIPKGMNSSSDDDAVNDADNTPKKILPSSQSKGIYNDNQENEVFNDQESLETQRFSNYKLMHFRSLKNLFQDDVDKEKNTSNQLPSYSIQPQTEVLTLFDLISSNTEKFLNRETKSTETILDTNKINFRILIVDDERLIRSGLKKFVRKFSLDLKQNIEFVESEDGLEALMIIYLYWKRNLKFDILITDETMPYMKGSTLMSVLKRLNLEGFIYSFPFISYTSYSDNEKISYILSQGAAEVVKKPTNYTSFQEILRLHLLK